MAASATFALKPGVWFRRGRLLMVSPDKMGTACPLSGRNSTYRPVQISGTGSDGAGGVDIVPSPHAAAAQGKRARHAAGITAQMIALHVSGRGARIHVHAGERGAGGETCPPAPADIRIHAGDEAAEIAVGRGGIAVAVERAPGAVGPRPERQRRGLRRDERLAVEAQRIGAAIE